MYKVFIWLGLVILINILGIILNKRLSKMPESTSRKWKRIAINIGRVFLTIVLLIIGFVAYLTRDVGTKSYDNFEDFQAESKQCLDCPEGARDLRMVINNRLVAKTYLLSYVLEDNELEALIAQTIQEKYTKTKSDGTSEIVYDKYYGVKVREIDEIEANYELDDFPHNLAFDSVIDDSVEDYTVIYYYPTLVGTTNRALLYNKETNRVLEYYYGQIK